MNGPSTGLSRVNRGAQGDRIGLYFGNKEDIGGIADLLRRAKGVRIDMSTRNSSRGASETRIAERARANLKAPNPKTRTDALFTAVQHNLRELSSEILDLFGQERDCEIKGRSAWALGRLRYHPAFNDLVQGLRDKDRRVRTWSAWALGEIGGDRASVPLMEAMKNEPVAQVQRAIGGALKKLRLESTRVHVKQVVKGLQPPPTKDQSIVAIIDKLESLKWEEDAERIIALRKEILQKDPAYFKAYMDWVKRKPALEGAWGDKRKVFSDDW